MDSQEATMAQPDDELLTRHHQLLLRVAGWAPDDVVSAARQWLAEGRVTEAARAVLGTVLADRVPIRPDDAELLVRTLPDVSQVTQLAGATPAGDPAAHPAFDFAPVRPEPFSPAPAPLLLDLTTAELDAEDAAAVAALDEVTGPVALWRVWRSPQPDRAAGGPVRVHVLETSADPALLPSATAALQNALEAAGVEYPQVEAYTTGVELPSYQRLARGRSALLWAAAKAQPITIARVFDSYDAGGGQFRADHPVLSAGTEPAQVLAYLEGGQVLLATTAKETDVFDPGAGAVVPMSFRTDGRWIWTDTVAYYLSTYALSPDEEFLAHIRALDYRLPAVDAVAEHRAMSVLADPG
jgi:hypothetical protein